jgi:flotillin
LRALVGQLEGAAQAVEREASVAAEQVRAEAEQELQSVRHALETKRLECEVVLPAEATRKGVELLSQGAAALQREQGLAAAETMRAMSQALTTAGPSAREMFVLSQLDMLVALVAQRVNGISVGEVHIVDGGNGQALPALAASFPAVVGAVFGTLKELTGVDVQAILAAPAAGGPR